VTLTQNIFLKTIAAAASFPPRWTSLNKPTKENMNLLSKQCLSHYSAKKRQVFFFWFLPSGSNSSTYDAVLSTGTIVGIFIGYLAGVSRLIGIIVTVIVCCKKKPGQVNIQQQQWPPGSYQQPPFGSVNNVSQLLHSRERQYSHMRRHSSIIFKKKYAFLIFI
jgi:hypothetical protein